MNGKDFEQLFEQIINNSREILVTKAKEYANDNDRLHNFKIAGAFLGSTPEQALLGMLNKHLVSIRDMCLSGDYYSPEKWDEKIGDAINYLILLKALTIEQ